MLEKRLITDLLEELVSNGVTDRRFRQFLRDLGPCGTYAVNLANEDTKKAVERAVSEHRLDMNGKCNIRARTFMSLFDTLASLKNDTLLRLVHEKGGKNAKIGASMALRYCNNRRLKTVLGSGS